MPMTDMKLLFIGGRSREVIHFNLHSNDGLAEPRRGLPECAHETLSLNLGDGSGRGIRLHLVLFCCASGGALSPYLAASVCMIVITLFSSLC